MNQQITEISKGSVFTKELLKGVDLIADIVGATMGPFGRNITIERKVHSVPITTNDGKRVARAINPEDPIQRFAVRALCEAAESTDLKAGDGTSGTIVFAQAIIHKVFEQLGNDIDLEGVKMKSNRKASVVGLRKEISDAKDKILKELEKHKKKANTLEDLEHIAITSVEDEKMGKTIADMIHKIGADGHVFVEEEFNFKTKTEIIEGMKFGGKIAAQFMLTNPNRMETYLENVPVLVTNHTIKGVFNLARPGGKWIVSDVEEDGENTLVILAWKFERAFLKKVADIWNKTGFRIICVNVPSILTEQLKDVSTYLGASFIDETQNMKLNQVGLSNLGKVKKFTANSQDVVLVGGGGKQEEIDKRIEEVKNQIKEEKLPEFRKQLEQRVGDLSAGIGVIKIGYDCQMEQLYVIDKVQDSVLATKEAFKTGMVKGGGVTLKEISAKLPKSILTESLLAPYNRIQENAGGDLEINEDVMDSYTSVKSIVENACSVAGTIITSYGGIYDKPDMTLDSLKDEILKLADKVGGREMPIDPDSDDER